MNQKNKKILYFAVAGIVAVVALYVPAKSVVGGVIACSRTHDNLRAANQDKIDQINSLEIFGEKPTKANVSTHGGCGSINPLGIEISKSYDNDINGGDAVRTVRSNMKGSGYTLMSENFGNEGCKAIYRMQAAKGKVKMYVTVFQEKKKIVDCTSGRPSGLSEQAFSEQTVEKALVKPL